MKGSDFIFGSVQLMYYKCHAVSFIRGGSYFDSPDWMNKECNYFLEYESFNGNLIKYECLSCDKNYSNKIDDKLKNTFHTTFKFSNNDINYFILLLRKSIYTYEYMDDSEYFNETTLPTKKIIFYQLKCGGYQRCKSHRCKKSLERLRNKKIR